MRKRRELSVSVGELNLDNEFMPVVNRSGDSHSGLEKDSRIQKLEERNVKLQEEVIRIERALSGISDKTTYGIRLPEIKTDVIKKELENAYKQIKQYQYEISKRKKLDLQGAYVEHIRKQERILKEKEQMSEKLRKEILETKKQTLQYTKLLKDDALKRCNAEKEKKCNADIKWLHEKLKKENQKKIQIEMNLEKERELIQKIQKELVKLDCSKTFMDNLKAKFLNAQVSTVPEEDVDEEIEPTEMRDIDIDERSPNQYEALMGEVRLYRKLQSDYEQKIAILTREKDESQQKNMASRNRLLEVQYEIEKIQARIAELKQQLDPKALIPTHIEAIKEEARRNNESKKIVKPKLGMTHLYHFAEIGEATKAGKRFIDRAAIGKKPARIIAISFYQSKQTQKLLGLKATYLVGKTRKEGSINILSAINMTEQRHFQLQDGDFVKTIDCLQDEKGKVVGVSMVSANNQILRAGLLTDIRKSIEIDPSEVPACLYGCLIEDGVEMLGTQTVKE